MPSDGAVEENITKDAGSCDHVATFVRGAMLLQEKWVLMIVHSLLGGRVGFSELMRKGSVNTTTLTQRLNLLVKEGVLVKTIHSTMPPRTSYELTESGRALRSVLDAITQWSGKYLPASTEEACPTDDEATESGPDACEEDATLAGSSFPK